MVPPGPGGGGGGVPPGGGGGGGLPGGGGGGGGVVAGLLTVTVPCMPSLACGSQTNVNVPGWVNVHVPAQSAASSSSNGSGIVSTPLGPPGGAVWLHDTPDWVKRRLCASAGSALLKVTVPPVTIWAFVEPVPVPAVRL